MTAELGKTRNVEIKDLQPGMKVHREIIGRKDKVLVGAGEILTRQHITKLHQWEKREKPQGSVLPRANAKNPNEPIRRAEFEGGWRPSHFNPRGVPVTATLSSGDEFPAVETDPTKSMALKTKGPGGTSTFSSPDTGIESPLFRCRALESEIAVLEKTNAQLGGALHTIDQKPVGEDELTARRDLLANTNEDMIRGMRDGKALPARASRKPR